jgi:FAD-linked oxidoreductase
VRAAAALGERVKVAGTGHSFTDIACTDGRLIKLDRYAEVLDVDPRRATVTVQAGITIARLSEELARHGLAMENMGDVAYQTISGAISTATHGTGERLRNIPSQVCALSLVLADGNVVQCSPTTKVDIFKAAQVGLGALGILSTVTLQCVPAFNLHSVREPLRLDDVLERFDQLTAGNDHFEFFWFPHTDRVQAITNNRTSEPARPKSRVAAYIDDIVLENHAFGVIQRAGRMRSSWIPGLAGMTARTMSKSEVTDRSDRVFANERLVRFAEMEYAVPRANLLHAVREVHRMIERSGLHISFPVEVRTVAADDIPLSPAYGRETGYIAVHVYWRAGYERFFRAVEAIMNAFDGRPHWGKLHYQTAETLRRRYPLWDSFSAVRDRLDPERRWGNAYLDRVLGCGARSGVSQ